MLLFRLNVGCHWGIKYHIWCLHDTAVKKYNHRIFVIENVCAHSHDGQVHKTTCKLARGNFFLILSQYPIFTDWATLYDAHY